MYGPMRLSNLCKVSINWNHLLKFPYKVPAKLYILMHVEISPCVNCFQKHITSRNLCNCCLWNFLLVLPKQQFLMLYISYQSYTVQASDMVNGNPTSIWASPSMHGDFSYWSTYAQSCTAYIMMLMAKCIKLCFCQVSTMFYTDSTWF